MKSTMTKTIKRRTFLIKVKFKNGKIAQGELQRTSPDKNKAPSLNIAGRLYCTFEIIALELAFIEWDKSDEAELQKMGLVD